MSGGQISGMRSFPLDSLRFFPRIMFNGVMRVIIYNDDGTVLESVVLCPGEELYGVDIPKNVWHNIECLESGSAFFECKEGPFVPHEEEGVMTVNGSR